MCVEKIRSVSNENADHFLVLKIISQKFRSVFVLKIRFENFRSVFSLKRSLTISRFWDSREKSQIIIIIIIII